MQIRASRISNSILEAISCPAPQSTSTSVYAYLLAFFSFFSLPLARYRPADFLDLRQNAWHLDEHVYSESFRPASRAKRDPRGKDREDSAELIPAGDLGYSGSTFFTTRNARYLIKALPRRFEHEFFTHDLFDSYVRHMKENPDSLLVRIVDMVYTKLPTLGGIVGTAPTHHIIMENLLFGEEAGEDGEATWETYDLKPADFFFPERDLAGGMLAPESVKDKLLDEFEEKVRVGSAAQRDGLLSVLERDTLLLQEHNAVDYSLFLVRYPGPSSARGGRSSDRAVPNQASDDAGDWRWGVDDVDGKWTYRAVVLDFFWAKHKLRAKAMTGLVAAFNLVADMGPMSITADPKEYRERFMKMVREMVVAV